MRRIAIVASVACMMTATPAVAEPVLLNQWHTFDFQLVGSSFETSLDYDAGDIIDTSPPSIAAASTPWTFTLLNPGSMTFLDGWQSGDQFSITNFGAIIGATSAAPSLDSYCGPDINACLASPAHSQGTFAFVPGSYSISGTALAPPFFYGSGFFRVTSAIPEPSSWAMVLLGFGFVGVVIRATKRRRPPIATCT